jgi:hypothetical protein
MSNSPAALVRYIQDGKPVDANDYHTGASGPGLPFRSTYGTAEFMTPSRNISCAISTDPDPRGNGIGCRIGEHSFADPPHRDCGHISFVPDYFGVGNSGVSQGACMGGQPFDPYSNVLPYGSTIQQGTIACRSESAFLACAEVNTQKGFIVSRDQFKTYP